MAWHLDTFEIIHISRVYRSSLLRILRARLAVSRSRGLDVFVACLRELERTLHARLWGEFRARMPCTGDICNATGQALSWQL